MVPVIPVAHELTDNVMRKHFLKSLWHDFVTFIVYCLLTYTFQLYPALCSGCRFGQMN